MSYNLQLLQRPQLFQAGSLTLWSSEHIGLNVLKKHLNPNIDSGSRKMTTIQSSVQWMLRNLQDINRVLDIGCGPGLYSYVLGKSGCIVEGIDVSPYQIEYAVKNSCLGKKTIYNVADFRNYSLTGTYDLALLLYGIYSFYKREERVCFLKKLYRHMSPHGCVMAEVFTKYHYINRQESADWEYMENGGFWSPRPYLELNAFRRYDQERTILIQAGVIDEKNIDVWNSWIQIFDENSITWEFREAGFKNFKLYSSCNGERFFPESDILCLIAY